ncbi:hypothetical protein [Celeribacter sp.]|uniref:hypothetical protein n=1 Tax=Celeribacter sp. TaxID=1890673 RepID=UPI003A91CB1F
MDQIITDILNCERDEEAPEIVDSAEGWSPFEARDFLMEKGLRTNDYHKGYDEYWANSEYIDLDSHILPNKAVFYIEGHEGVATTLKLTGKFTDDFDSGEAIQKLKVIGALLCEKAVGHGDKSLGGKISERQRLWNVSDPFSMSLDKCMVIVLL